MTSSPLTLADAQALAASFLEARRAKHADFRMDATSGDGGNGGEPNGQNDPSGQTDPNAQTDPPKSTEEQLAELTASMEELKRNSRKWETRAKENKAAADELAQLKATNATPDQKLSAAEKRAETAERELARFRVAASTGLPADLAEMLTGNDEEAMEEQAKKLLARLVPAKPERQTPVKPDPSQGGSGGQKKVSAADEGRAEAQRRYGNRKS
jgi:hypothetical protein